MIKKKKKRMHLQWLERILNDFLLDKKTKSKRAFKFDLFILGLILISAVMFVAETYTVSPALSKLFVTVDTVIIGLFTLEYLARIYVAEKKAKYIFSWVGIVDFLAFAPFWISFFIPWISTLQFLRVLRIFKIFRFFQRHLDSDRVSQEYVSKILMTKMLFVVSALLYVSAALIFTIEAPQNPHINTFDDAVYFSLVTVTAVGFGDITPVTRAGRLVIMFIIMAGVLLIPVYVASLLRTYMMNTHKVTVTCKKCGLRQHDENAVYCKACGKQIYQEHNELIY